MPQYKLTYFNVKALAEPIRYILSYMGEDFEDIRIPRESWNSELKNATPFGKVPTLEIDGKTYYDSKAICGFLATKAGLSWNSPMENLQIEQVMGALGDFIGEIRRVVRADPSEKEKIKETIVNETIPFYMPRFEKIMDQNNGFLANGKLSWVDIYFVAWSESVPGIVQVKLEDKYKKFAALKEKVHSLPGIKDWIQRRPVTEI